VYRRSYTRCPTELRLQHVLGRHLRAFRKPYCRSTVTMEACQGGRRNKIVQWPAGAGIWCFVILTQPQLLVLIDSCVEATLHATPFTKVRGGGTNKKR
jgi:hypothetical protein